MSQWLGGEVTDKAGDGPEKMAGPFSFLLPSPYGVNTLLELLRQGGIATAFPTGPMYNSPPEA